MTAGKVRAALIESTGAIDVYFEEEIEILISDESVEFPQSEVEKLLEENELDFSSIERSKYSG